ncbi:MAG: hypothetical protein A2Y88_09040 [Chloroflexi bacterium RBG_13_48_10]|nr:MAG: hypothetical protein A2Y88_09040 [Chloroflexi bacterium RBG_13_48_10]
MLLIIFFLVGVQDSKAETAYVASLTAPDTSDFPHLTTYLDVHDPEGGFVHGLTPQDVTLLENNLQIPASELQERQPGVQFVMAITPGDSFSINDTLGVSRYEYLRQGLLEGTWVNQQSGVDDFSLLTMGGPQNTHSSDPNALRSSLETYLPDDTRTISSLEVLASALQVVSDPTSRPGMERMILFITPPQGSETSLGLQSIIANARQQNIRIYVWMVGSQDVFDLPETELLRNLAQQTQGTFFAFSHDEPVPDLESLLEPLRSIYYLGYDSQITSAGEQQLAAQVTVGNEQITTESKSFDVNLLAPAPTLINTPEEIIRTFENQPTPGTTGIDANLVPTEQMINILVRFPDGYDRPLARTILYVDGVLYSENTSSPYDQFMWDLQPYTQDSVHTLRVEAIDSLGITGNSEETTVRIIVPTTTQGMMVVFSQKRPLLAGLVILISASILILVLILGGRIRPKPHPGQVKPSVDPNAKTRPISYQARVHQRKDSVTQPVKITPLPPHPSTTRSKSWRERLPWLKPKQVPAPAIAYLIPLMGTGETTLPEPFRIISDETTLGRDSLKANIVIADPSIENLHARIHHEGTSFLITDADTVAGTWVNYKPVPPMGIQLEHADIIHLGQVVFRFTLAEPGQLREIVITPLEADQ